MKELLTRSITGAVFVAAIILACWFGEPGLLTLGSLVLAMGAYEVYRALAVQGRVPLIYLALHLATLIGAFWALQVDFRFTHALLWVSFTTLLLSLLDGRVSGDLRIPATTLLTSAWISLGMLSLMGIFFLGGKQWMVVLGVFILVWTNDTFAYLTGRLKGRTKLWERISPKKTIEGSVGGLLFTVAAGVLIAYLLEQSYLFWSGAAILSTVFGALGDLLESSVKRQLGVKDLGHLLPGHGGVMDRFDAILLAAPAVMTWLLYVPVTD